MAIDEKKIADKWYNSNVYKWMESDKKDTFAIDTPPPTVSGQLHMGHVFSYTQADFIARYKRMKGLDVFYPIGFDDNGLPTERLTEKIKGVRGVEMAKEGRKDEFMNMCKEVVADAEIEFEKLFKALGLSFDWSQKYQTISSESVALAHASFDDLISKGLIYQASNPVYWCTVDRTALAQADLVDKEMDSEEVTFKCNIDGEEFYIDENGKQKPHTIMTTRPEMIPACVMVLYHPDDIRYNNKIKNNNYAGVKIPFLSHKVPLIPDEDVKIDKGTGLVMCCSYGDWQDVKWIERPMFSGFTPSANAKDIISKNGRIHKDWYNDIALNNWFDLLEKKYDEIAWEQYYNKYSNESNLNEDNSFKVKDARIYAIKNLKEKHKIAKNEDAELMIKDIKHTVKCAERSEQPVEIIRVRQYYIPFGFAHGYPSEVYNQASSFSDNYGYDGEVKNGNGKYFKKNLLAIVERIDFKPTHLKQRLIDWINGLNQDWCISRDRFSGVPIPGSNQVFDTWFTSSVSPQLNTGIINPDQSDNTKNYKGLEQFRGYKTEALKERHNKIFPMDLRPQAHEIIRTWAFYTIVKAYLHACQWDEQTKEFIIKNKQGNIIDLQNTTQDELIEAKAIPWKTVALSGWCLASDKTKMSKSKGNIITPMPLIEEKGADVVRYWASCSHLGVDTHYNETKFVDGKKLINKLRNVAKFLSPHLKDIKLSSPAQSIANNEITETSDLWILSKLQDVIEKVDDLYADYNYCQARETAERFFWDIFCDNYLEIIKSRAYGIEAFAYKYDKFKKTEQQIIKLKKSAVLAGCYVLHTICKMLAPIIPFVTEEIQHYMTVEYCKINMLYTQQQAEDFADHNIIENSIHRIENWIKEEDKVTANANAVELGDYMLEVIEKVRKYKADNQLSIKTPITKITLPKLPTQIEFDLISVINAFEAKIEIGANIDLECMAAMQSK